MNFRHDPGNADAQKLFQIQRQVINARSAFQKRNGGHAEHFAQLIVTLLFFRRVFRQIQMPCQQFVFRNDGLCRV